MRPATPGLGRHRFAVVTAGATLALIFAGGLVTSTGSGLAVPDWPLAFGQVFPRMEGGVLFEHGHRLIAAGVGLLTTVLAAWLWWREPRAWVRGLGLAALAAVVVQGLLGGATVLLGLPPAVSVLHAGVAQAYFCLMVIVALVTGPRWAEARFAGRASRAPGLHGLCLVATGVVYGQILLGAGMRHLGAGLAIPDFPLALGRVIPPLDAWPVAIHFAHRVGAAAAAVAVVWTAARILRRREVPGLAGPARLALALLGVQIALGALTIWTVKAVVPTTAHVAGGAALLGTLVVLACRTAAPAGARRDRPVPGAAAFVQGRSAA
jgi:cytochrome c oxidase assembly protein subunit 15